MDSAGQIVTEVIQDVDTATERLASSASPILEEQVLRELIRADRFEREWGQQPFYVLAAAHNGEVVGLLPGYAMAGRGPVASVVLGSAGVKRSMLAIREGHPHVTEPLVEAALSRAVRYAPELIIFTGLDDEQFKAVLPLVPAEHWISVVHHAVIDTEFGTFEDYAASLSRARRQRLHHETRRFRDAGFVVERMEPVDVSALVPLLGQVQAKYGEAPPDRMLESYLDSLVAAFGERANVLVARADERLAAFQVLCDMGQEWWLRCFGCDYSMSLLRTAGVYFNLAIYESIRRAVRGGAKRLCLGTGSLEAKTLRGATLHALASITLDGP